MGVDTACNPGRQVGRWPGGELVAQQGLHCGGAVSCGDVIFQEAALWEFLQHSGEVPPRSPLWGGWGKWRWLCSPMGRADQPGNVAASICCRILLRLWPQRSWEPVGGGYMARTWSGPTHGTPSAWAAQGECRCLPGQGAAPPSREPLQKAATTQSLLRGHCGDVPTLTPWALAGGCRSRSGPWPWPWPAPSTQVWWGCQAAHVAACGLLAGQQDQSQPCRPATCLRGTPAGTVLPWPCSQGLVASGGRDDPSLPGGRSLTLWQVWW